MGDTRTREALPPRQGLTSSHAGTGRPLLRKNSGFQSFE
jgi:hypothetical protein